MKIKILLTGNDGSRHQFFTTLSQHVKYEQAGASLNVVGTGTYRFKLGKDDIEIFYVEDHPLLKKNFKNYAVGINAVILLDPDKETEEKIAEALPMIPVCQNTPDQEINALNGVKLAVKKVYAKLNAAKLAGNANTQFSQPKPAVKTVAGAKNEGSVNIELLKQFLAERAPRPK